MNDIRIDIANKHFEIIKTVDDNGNESWSARDLMVKLGYETWQSFERVINKAKDSCRSVGIDVNSNFSDITKVYIKTDGKPYSVKDIKLSRYACYLIAQNGDPTKEQIALAQAYFAIQTRKQEVMQENVRELERLTAREKLSTTEKKFSGVMFEQGIDGKGIANIRARGDKKLFGGNSTDDMKKRLQVPDNRPLADFLPTITIKAKDLATEMTTFKTKEKGLIRQETIATTHEAHNASVRQALVGENIYPEHLPKEQDIKKLERKIKKDQKQLTSADKSIKIKSGSGRNRNI